MKIKLQGIPLRLADWSETSQVVTLITDKLGRVSGVARGAYRLRSAFDGPFDHLCHYQVVWMRSPKASLGLFTESFCDARPLEFRDDPVRMRWALSCIERTRELTEDEDRSTAYVDLRRAFNRMLAGEDPRRVHDDFTIRLLAEAGFGPVTGYCVVSGRERTRRGTVPYSARYGGILAPESAHLDRDAVPLRQDVADRIDAVRDGGEAGDLVPRRAKELTRLLTDTVQHIAGKALNLGKWVRAACWTAALLPLTGCLWDNRPADVVFEEALQRFEEGSPVRAGWRVETLENKHPESTLTPQAMWVMALDEIRRDRFLDARDTLGRLLKRYPDHALFPRALRRRFDLIRAEFMARRVEEGGRVRYEVGEGTLEALEETADFAPWSTLADEARLMVADARLGRQEFDEAELLYRQILANVDRDSPLEVTAQFRLGFCHWDRAVVRVRGFLSRRLRNPHEPLAPEDRRIAVRFSDRYPAEAVREFSEVIRRFPDSDEATQSRRIIAEIRQLQAMRLLVLGDFYRFYGKMDSARHYWKRLLRDFPDADATGSAKRRLDELLEQ